LNISEHLCKDHRFEHNEKELYLLEPFSIDSNGRRGICRAHRCYETFEDFEALKKHCQEHGNDKKPDRSGIPGLAKYNMMSDWFGFRCKKKYYDEYSAAWRVQSKAAKVDNAVTPSSSTPYLDHSSPGPARKKRTHPRSETGRSMSKKPKPIRLGTGTPSKQTDVDEGVADPLGAPMDLEITSPNVIGSSAEPEQKIPSSSNIVGMDATSPVIDSSRRASPQLGFVWYDENASLGGNMDHDGEEFQSMFSNPDF
jgi:hypothetical protein